MSSLLSAAQIIDTVRSYGNLTALTKVSFILADGSSSGGTSVTADQYKNIGPNYLDWGSNAYTSRISLDEQFISVTVFGPPRDEIRFMLPMNTPYRP